MNREAERKRLVELICNCPSKIMGANMFLEKISLDLADHLLDNGIVVPPCKVGDKVYYPSASFEEFAEAYKIVDSKEVYTNGTELIPIFRVKQWLEHKSVEVKHGYWKDRCGNKYANHLYECSVCGKEPLYEFYSNELQQTKTRQVLSNGCPHCLAKMDERKEGVE